MNMTEKSSKPPCMERIGKVFNQVTMVLLFLMMVLVVVDVFGRYLFSSPFPGTLELTEVFMVYLVFLSLAYTESQGMHVRAQTLIMRFSDNKVIMFDLFAYGVSLVFFSFMTYATLMAARASWQVRQATETIDFPVYPAKFAMSFGCFLIVFVLLGKIVRSLRQLMRYSPEPGARQDHGVPSNHPPVGER